MTRRKTYSAPTLKTQVIQLGVFGTYQDTPPSGKDEPLRPISDLDLRMD